MRSERANEIKAKHKALKEKTFMDNLPLYEVLEKAFDMEDDTEPCLICNL